MEINNGWVKWEEIGETLDVELKGIQYNKNGNPYAVANKLTPLKEGESPFVKFNISKTDVGLKQGRYTVKVVSINNGFGYVEFKPLQDSSWDVHDELANASESRTENRTERKEIQLITEELKGNILKTLELTHLYEKEIPYINTTIYEDINSIKRQLYLELGELVANEQENK